MVSAPSLEEWSADELAGTAFSAAPAFVFY
jgi:hypothetical protein